ncbi:elongation factor P hydroxylase [Aestuariibacter sp. A3R04]|uniref:elongation factor P hydroxylase n=1 Tax=Aestuariibacter sp. A3R04 TaxID=2841571 RepID=UPI001C0838D5|nr:elongation factor P hydroxylase [Aestuariibacter sp. A3R04]MBU3023314.1 elongation factor P hydroxylase [Aestuariibacter sp. A3R04]
MNVAKPLNLAKEHPPGIDTDADVDALIALFHRVFFEKYNTRLVRGDDEPVYLPANQHTPYHQIVFAHGFYASALHEIAHWCIAGPARRLQEDYGYWYCPDGRDAQQQRAFEQVEVKPQALEWAFTLASGRRFRVSTDNLNGAEPNRESFTRTVHKQLLAYCIEGFPYRAQLLLTQLHGHFKTPHITRVLAEAELS